MYVGLMAVAVAATAFTPGCSRRNTDTVYFPPAAQAHNAVEAALAAWKSGKPVGAPLEGTTPTVRVVDSAWERGQRLAAFEILREETSEDAAPMVVVRLTMVGKPTPIEVRYLVAGVDPLWVYREDDSKFPGGM
jgi:hypothetical protein